MTKRMLIDAAHPEETRVTVVNGNRLEEFDFETASKIQLKGNIYLAKVTRVEPSLQAAFVEYGGNRHGFLAFSEIHPDYFRIPVSDRQDDDVEEEAPPPRKQRRGGSRSGRGGRRGGAAVGPVEPVASVADSAATADPEAATDPTDAVDAAPEAPASTETPDDGAGDPPMAEAETELAPIAEAPAEDAPAVDDVPEATAADPAVIEPVESAAESEAAAPSDDTPDETPAAMAASEDVSPADASLPAPAEDVALAQDPSADDQPVEDAPAEDAPADDQPEEASLEAEAAGDDPFGDDPLGEDPRESDGRDDDDIVLTPSETTGRRRRRRKTAAGPPIEEKAESIADVFGPDADTGSQEAPILAGETVIEPDEDSGDDDADGPGETRSRRPGGADIEIVGGDDTDNPEAQLRPRPRQSARNYKIQEVIKRRQIMLVQVTKEERGNKGAALTTFLSLAGRYCVLMPNTPRGGGVSRKIANPKDRKRMKQILEGLEVPDGMAVILRTAGLERTKAEIKRDLDYLLRLWDSIRELTLVSAAPALINAEGDLIKRAIRDLYTKEIDEVLVSGTEGYRTAKDFMKMLMPSHAKKVQQYKEDIPLFHRYQVESQIEVLHQPVSQLKSGGYVVINPTEALVAIDVNSGRSTRERNIEETAYRTNLEAAEEIARQLRLRDLAGLIVIDFIDMEEDRHVSAVERRLKEAMKQDRARIQIGRISAFGLLELSRQRLRPSFLEMHFETCPHCTGTGVVRTLGSSALHVLRAVEEEGLRRRSQEITVHCPTDIALYILNQKRDALAAIEQRYGFSVQLQRDDSLIGPDHRVERIRARTEDPERPTPTAIDAAILMAETDAALRADVEVEEAPAESQGEDGDRPSGRSKRRRRRGDRKRDADVDVSAEAVADDADAGDAEDSDAGTEARAGDDSTDDAGGDDKAKRRRRRGKRGGRRRSSGRGDEIGAEAQDGVDGEPGEAVAAGDEATDEAAEASETGTDEAQAEVVDAAAPDQPTDDEAPSADAVDGDASSEADVPAETEVSAEADVPADDAPIATEAAAEASEVPGPVVDEVMPETVEDPITIAAPTAASEEATDAPAEPEPETANGETAAAETPAQAADAEAPDELINRPPEKPKRGWWQRLRSG